MAKRAALVAFVAIGAACPAFAQDLPTGTLIQQSFDKRWEVILNSETRFQKAEVTADGRVPVKTRYFSVPVGMQISGNPTDDLKIEVQGRSSHVDTRSYSPNFNSSFDGWTDTSVLTTVTYSGFNGFQPFASLALNLPTGKTVLKGRAAGARPDSEIFDIPGFGEGFNIGPTVGVRIPVSQAVMVSFGAGYTGRGSFDREGIGGGLVQIDTDPSARLLQHLNPGDVITINGTIAYQEGRVALQASGSYSFETTTTVDGTPFYKAGDRYFIAVGAGYAWTDMVTSKITASFSHFNKNHVTFTPPTTPLIVEQFNTNSNVVVVNFDTTFKIGMLSIGPSAGILFRDNNGYNPTTFEFLPEKTKYTVGATAQLAANDKASFNARAEHVWSVTDATPDKGSIIGPLPGTGTPKFSLQGWLFSFGGIFKF